MRPTTEDLPPHSIEAEQGVLGCLLLKPDLLHDTAIPDGLFYDLRHRTIFQALATLRAPADLITLGNELRSLGVLENIGGVAYLLELQGTVPSEENLPHYLAITKEKYAARKLIRLASEAKQTAQTDPDKALYDLEIGVTTLVDDGKAESLTSKDAAKLFIDHLQERLALQGKISGLPTGISKLDELTDGFQEGELTIIGARPSIGKTAFAGTVALANLDTPTLVVTVEMSVKALFRRLVASLANVSITDMKKGYLTERDQHALTAATATLARSKLRWLDFSAGGNIIDVMAAMRRETRKHGIRLALVDYLQQIKPSQRLDARTYEVEEVSKALKQYARATNVATVVLAQTNRDTEKGGKKREPNLADLSDSSAIEKDADLVIFLDRNREEPEGKASLIVAKGRDNETGRVPAHYIGRFCRFEDGRVEIDKPKREI